ncbi:MAG TPA: multiheme c-type cytochrome [Terriglobales bacterium]|jgi:hypothetical protein|nr:multiheme c-type cytochrome [Terriglobales bacterium]
MNCKAKLLALVTLLVAMEVAAQNNSSQPTPANSLPKASPRENYVGDDACRSCHQDKVESFHQTAHYLTSRLPDKNSILGSFSPDANTLKTSNPNLFFQMEARDEAFYQTAVQGVQPYLSSRSERFGLVVGSGGKGQTFLFWKGDLLFQLPVSYWREVGWVNSPGYRDGVAYFDRAVIPRCLECHGTYFESLAPPPNRYRQTGFVAGITCEKCHGPGRAHAERYASKAANVASGAAILNPAQFSRERQMDLCAWCHAGHGVALLPAFSYIPGEPLDKYLALPQLAPDEAVDVHGSQVELLKKSRCFQSSTMTCLTCHDVHLLQKDPVAFSEHCLRCHKSESHRKMTRPIAGDCIDCHMPKQQTNLIVFNWNGRKVSPEVRNHWIKIYPEVSSSPEKQNQKQ